MYTQEDQQYIKILVADDDENVLDCYLEAFSDELEMSQTQVLDALAADLFDSDEESVDHPKFDIVACSQGADAIKVADAARKAGQPFDVVILDVRMPPGIDGVEAGTQIRKLDPTVEIVFVTGYSDVSFEEMQRRVPPPVHLHYFSKPLSFAKLAEDVVTMVSTH